MLTLLLHMDSLHDHGVAAVRFVGDWCLLLALCYDSCLRGYNTETGDCKFVQANENRCMFSALEVDSANGEVCLHRVVLTTVLSVVALLSLKNGQKELWYTLLNDWNSKVNQL